MPIRVCGAMKLGIATIKISAPNPIGGSQSVTVRVSLFEMASTLYALVAKELDTTDVK